jgi:mRNA interferase MazF
MASPLRGEVWMVEFDPVRGHEQAGRRPALVVSSDVFNRGHADLLIVLPLTTKARTVRSHVAILAGEAGLRRNSFIKCEDVRSIAKERVGRRLGSVSRATLSRVETVLRLLLDV